MVNYSFLFRIPLNDIISLQAIDQYCQDIVGNMQFHDYCNPKRIVCCPIYLKTTFNDSYLEILKPSDLIL
jgi:hypothetical protein